MEALELREALGEAHAARDFGEAEALAVKVRSRLDTVMADVAKAFAATPTDLATISARLVTVRYYRRFLDEARVVVEDGIAREKEKGGHAG
jgi:hypothetical protein